MNIRHPFVKLAALGALVAALPLLMAPSGGYPVRPQFQAVGIGTIADPLAGRLTIQSPASGSSRAMLVNPALAAQAGVCLSNGAATCIAGDAVGDANLRLGSGTARISNSTGSTILASITSTGGWTIPAPVGTTALVVNGIANSYGQTVQASLTSGQSFGLQVLGGTTAADVSFRALNASAGSVLFQIAGDGGMQAGAPTGGDKGAGTLNVAGNLFVNGAAVATSLTYSLIANVAGAGPTIVSCTNCGANSIARTAAGIYSITIAPGVLVTWACGMRNVSGNAPGVEVSLGAVSSTTIPVNLFNFAGALADGAAGTQISCTGAL